MNEPLDEKAYVKLVKMFRLRLDYRPGPNMEQKILKALRRRKRRMLFFRVSVIVLVALIVLWLGPSRTRITLIYPLSKTIERESAEQTQQSDLMFKTLKYTSVANDGNWSEDW